MKTISILKTLCLTAFFQLAAEKIDAQQITVTGTITFNSNGVVDCYLNYSKLAESEKTVLFLDTASHLRYIRKKKRGEDSPWKLEWNPSVMKSCYYYATAGSEENVVGLPDQFSMHYYFKAPLETGYSIENMEEALMISSVKKKMFPTLYNTQTGKTVEGVSYEIFLEKKLEVGLDIKFVELEYEDPFYFALSAPSNDDLKENSNGR
jgi:hypothetical protein